MSNSFFGGNQLLDAYALLERVGLHAGNKVADLGCGAIGYFTLPAASIVGDNGSVFAVDILKNALNNVSKLAKEANIQNIYPIWSNIEKYGSIDIADSYIDLAILATVLFQSDKHLDIFKETIRILVPGGKILVIDWKQIKSPLGPPLELRVKKYDIERLLLSLKMKELESFDAGKYHFGLLFQKP